MCVDGGRGGWKQREVKKEEEQAKLPGKYEVHRDFFHLKSLSCPSLLQLEHQKYPLQKQPTPSRCFFALSAGCSQRVKCFHPGAKAKQAEPQLLGKSFKTSFSSTALLPKELGSNTGVF